MKQPENGQQKKRPKNGNGHGRHLGTLLPEEYPEAIIAISLAIESCKNLQSTKDAKTFSRCLAGSGEKHGIRSVVCEEVAGKCMVVSKIKAGHELLTVYGEVHEYRDMVRSVSLAQEVLSRRVQHQQ